MKRARFISGAQCPSCGAVDRIVIEEAPDGRVQRCVACSHREKLAQHAADDATMIQIPAGGSSNAKVQ